jgi:hypothetical protein
MGIIPFSQLAVRKEFFFIKTHIPGDASCAKKALGRRK